VHFVEAGFDGRDRRLPTMSAENGRDEEIYIPLNTYQFNKIEVRFHQDFSLLFTLYLFSPQLPPLMRRILNPTQCRCIVVKLLVCYFRSSHALYFTVNKKIKVLEWMFYKNNLF
jgi:hypothetical protein